MKTVRQLLAVCAIFAGPAWADEGGVKVSGNMEVWGYGSALGRISDSPFNPNNRVADLPSVQWTAETRINLRLRHDDTELVLRPRLMQQHNVGNRGESDHGEAYLAQGFIRQRLGTAWTLTAGRELLTWGPGNFRSPSNPIYFDAGKTNPLRDVSGVDLARISVTEGAFSATVARVFSDGHLVDKPLPDPVTLAKFDLRGDNTQFSAIAATGINDAPFFGAFAQATLGDAWLVYGEIGSGRRRHDLQANPLAGWPFVSQSPSPRKTTALLGASYTLENGQTLALEWLHDGHGYRRSESRAVFAKVDALADAYLAAPGGPMAGLQLRAIGQSLGQAPALLGRDYLALQWQSNPQESESFWRLNWNANLTDRSHQFTAYYERNLSQRWSAFVVLGAQQGPRDSEAERLWDRRLSLGVKLFAF